MTDGEDFVNQLLRQERDERQFPAETEDRVWQRVQHTVGWPAPTLPSDPPPAGSAPRGGFEGSTVHSATSGTGASSVAGGAASGAGAASTAAAAAGKSLIASLGGQGMIKAVALVGALGGAVALGVELPQAGPSSPDVQSISAGQSEGAAAAVTPRERRATVHAPTSEFATEGGASSPEGSDSWTPTPSIPPGSRMPQRTQPQGTQPEGVQANTSSKTASAGTEQPSEAAPEDAILRELALFRSIRAAIAAGAWGTALQRIAEHERDFPAGRLATEREVARVRAHCASGAVRAAKETAQRLSQRAGGAIHRIDVDHPCGPSTSPTSERSEDETPSP